MKLWKDMTPEEKGALLLSYHEGKVIQYRSVGDSWDEATNDKCKYAPLGWYDDYAYRVKPEPKPKPVVTEVVMYGNANYGSWSCGMSLASVDTHKITFNLVDGEPDCNSIKMVKL